MNLKGKKVLVTGGTGLIGQQLVPLLLEKECIVTVVSLDNPSLCPAGAHFEALDLTVRDNCNYACQGQDIVFNLIGIKTSPLIIKTKPASIFQSFLSFNTNMIEASRIQSVQWFLYTSTIGVYPPAEVMVEDDMWDGFPSKNDWYGGWGKRMGEMLIETYKIQYGLDNFSIIRPANVYGPFDDFSETSMVIPALIKRAIKKENPFVVWGDGTPIRDFIFARDVAKGMIYAVENEIKVPLNMGSGTGLTIKEIVNKIIKLVDYNPEIEWDTTKPMGDKKRILSMEKSKSYGFQPMTSLEDGLRETINWYVNNYQDIETKRFNVFKT